jgi:hypothetical protein
MRKKPADFSDQTCPHCGGIHIGVCFDNCPYVNIVKSPNQYTPEQVKNAKEWLELWAIKKAH